jgi:hypothetical protein
MTAPRCWRVMAPGRWGIDPRTTETAARSSTKAGERLGSTTFYTCRQGDERQPQARFQGYIP